MENSGQLPLEHPPAKGRSENAIPSLHDATLRSVLLNWKEGRCSFNLSTAEAPECSLEFSGVSQLAIPRELPWGPSVSVNGFTCLGTGVYELELQSGDVLSIEAQACKFASGVGAEV